MQKTTFHVAEMDCSSEEQLIRMKLEDLTSDEQLEFDLADRRLEVYHNREEDQIKNELAELELGEEVRGQAEAQPPTGSETTQRKILWWVLGINFSFFVIEMSAGWFAWSMGLVADSLDMLADSTVYALSLFAVRGVVSQKKTVARLSGYFQAGLALLGFLEVLRRFLTPGGLPLFDWMIAVALLAMAGNIVSLWLINQTRTREAHMQASAIFTSNDIIVNGGVITAGVLVYLLESKWPDLVVVRSCLRLFSGERLKS